MFQIFVPGVARPQGSKKAFNRGGRIILVEASAGLPAWRDKLVKAIKERNHERFEDAVSVSLTFFMNRPKTVKREHMTVAPDIDKLIRAVFDALTISEIILDDSYVVRVEANKLYANDGVEGVQIFIRNHTQKESQC